MYINMMEGRIIRSDADVVYNIINKRCVVHVYPNVVL